MGTTGDFSKWFHGSPLLQTATSGDVSVWFHGAPVLQFEVPQFVVFRDQQIPYESVASPIFSTALITFEASEGLRAERTVPHEARGRFVADVVFPYEARGEATSSRGVHYESLLSISQDRQASLESLLALSMSSSVVWEGLRSAMGNAQIPIEARGRVAPDVLIPYASNADLLRSLTLPYEILRGASLESISPWEALGGVAGTRVAVFEARFGVPAPLLIPSFGRLFLGPTYDLQLTVDPEPYEAYVWPRRMSTHQMIQGGITVQDFGLYAQDLTLTLRHDVMDDVLVQTFDHLYRAGATLKLLDWLGNDMTVRIAAFRWTPHGRLALSRYEMTLRVLAIGSFLGVAYVGP